MSSSRRGHAGTQQLSLASLLYSSSSWAHQQCLSAHHPHLMLLDLLFIQLCRLDMWNTSPINNWVMLCSPLGGGLGCSGEIKGVLWRLRHRSGTWSPWALWKQKRGITGNREIGKKINKICLAVSDREGKWYVKQGMGHGNQVENRTSAVFDKSWLEASLRSAATAGLLPIVWALGRQRYIIWAGVQ